MYERFTDRARKVMQLAKQEAQRLQHDYLGTEHILLGLLQEGSGVAASILKSLEVSPEKIRAEVMKIVQSGPKLGSEGDKLPQTPRAKKVIECAIAEARDMGHNYVGTEHLLLGLLGEGEGLAAQVLMDLGLKVDDVREELRHLLGASSVQKPAEPGSPLPDLGQDLIQCFNEQAEERPMVVVSRKKNERIVLNGTIIVTVVEIRDNKVRLGVTGPGEVAVHRQDMVDAPHLKGDTSMLFNEKSAADVGPTWQYPDGESFYKRCTDQARAVIALADDEAREFNHEYIGTEHILLAVARQDVGAAADVLKALGIDLLTIRNEVEKIVARGPRPLHVSRIPLTPRAKKVLEFACAEAHKLGQDTVGTEHLLLGLLREEEGVAAQILLNLGLSLTVVRRKVLGALGHFVDTEAPAPTNVITLPHLPEPVRSILDAYDGQIESLQSSRDAAVAADNSARAARLGYEITLLKQSRKIFLTIFGVEMVER